MHPLRTHYNVVMTTRLVKLLYKIIFLVLLLPHCFKVDANDDYYYNCKFVNTTTNNVGTRVF